MHERLVERIHRPTLHTAADIALALLHSSPQMHIAGSCVQLRASGESAHTGGMRAGRVRLLSTSYAWSRTHAPRRGGDALERLARGDWAAASVVTRLFGTWAMARAAIRWQDQELPDKPATVGDVAVGQQVDLAA
jgi:hypothetical protein